MGESKPTNSTLDTWGPAIQRRLQHGLWAIMLAGIMLAANAGELALGDRAPAMDVDTIDGRVIAARQLENRVVLHYFWATWCPLCRVDLPTLQKLYETNQAHGFEIVAHALDNDRGTVVEFWREHGYTFPAAMRSNAVRPTFGPIQGTPTYVLVDRAGSVRLRRLGAMPNGALGAQVKVLLSR